MERRQVLLRSPGGVLIGLVPSRLLHADSPNVPTNVKELYEQARLYTYRTQYKQAYDCCAQA
ncbi:MAG TPA: hypothetical protein VEN79_10850 [Terriglobia bacterium]|nr:hypothetical protein [Terriglobia bacterium]